MIAGPGMTTLYSPPNLGKGMAMSFSVQYKPIHLLLFSLRVYVCWSVVQKYSVRSSAIISEF